MKSKFTLLAAGILAALALAGCNQNTPSNSTDTQSTNSSMTVGTTNAPATIVLPDTDTNAPTSTNH
jgi:outer membrane murein-binding lipoprotein Lpp